MCPKIFRTVSLISLYIFFPKKESLSWLVRKKLQGGREREKRGEETGREGRRGSGVEKRPTTQKHLSPVGLKSKLSMVWCCGCRVG